MNTNHENNKTAFDRPPISSPISTKIHSGSDRFNAFEVAKALEPKALGTPAKPSKKPSAFHSSDLATLQPTGSSKGI
jgi:hypothetical protein